MKTIKAFSVSCAVMLTISSTFASTVTTDEGYKVRGKYLIAIGGCNDCHTADFALSGGNIPESQWLLGNQLGFRGPWGTTYPVNLRAYFNGLTESEWVTKAKQLKTRPPMPWWALNAMTKEDLTALYKYVRSLDYVKTGVPAFVPPNGVPTTPYIQWPVPPKQ